MRPSSTRMRTRTRSSRDRSTRKTWRRGSTALPRLVAALREGDEDEGEFVQGSVDAKDLATGFNATIPTREVGVDEDIQGDEVVQAGGEELLTELEVTGEANGVVRGDEIQLDLEDALTSGKTVTEAPEGD